MSAALSLTFFRQSCPPLFLPLTLPPLPPSLPSLPPHSQVLDGPLFEERFNALRFKRGKRRSADRSSTTV